MSYLIVTSIGQEQLLWMPGNCEGGGLCGDLVHFFPCLYVTLYRSGRSFRRAQSVDIKNNNTEIAPFSSLTPMFSQVGVFFFFLVIPMTNHDFVSHDIKWKAKIATRRATHAAKASNGDKNGLTFMNLRARSSVFDPAPGRVTVVLMQQNEGSTVTRSLRGVGSGDETYHFSGMDHWVFWPYMDTKSFCLMCHTPKMH